MAIERLLLPVLVQLAVIIAASRLVGALARRAGQPAVVGEIIAGLLLGPSLFGWLCPEWSARVFHPTLEGVPDGTITNVFAMFSQIGLIFLLFLVGLEVDFQHLKERSRSAIAIAVAGLVVPFAMGVGLALAIHPQLELMPGGRPVPRVSLALFMGVALAITAIPVLGRIMLELGIARTRIGTITMTAAALEDAAGWILLAAIVAVTRNEFEPEATLKMTALTVAFVLGMIVVVRPLLGGWLKSNLVANDGTLSLNALTVLLVALILAALATNLIGIFAIFGAFVLGAALSGVDGLRDAVAAKWRDLVSAFFLPIFFTFTGLQTDVGHLKGDSALLIAVAVIATAIAGKLLVCGLAARIGGFPAKEAAIIGSLMNTRGLMELIVINIGRQVGVIPPSLYTTLVLMAIVTTLMTTPLLLLLRRGTEIEEPIARSPFANR